MDYKKTAVVLCLFLALINNVFAQQPDFLNNLQQYSAANPQEKVYLHLDKPHYLTGDDIWLKGYVTFGVQNQLSAFSKILYVDLIDPANKVIDQTKFLVLHGVAIGDIHLADSLKQGTYHLRAYTNWMRNLPQETFFNKAFTIGRVQDGAGQAQSKPNNNAIVKQVKDNSISFMPEGGDMVAGLQSRIAFKMLQPDGLAASGNGYVTDDSGEKLVEFTSGYAGMGSFFLNPQAGKTYKAVVTYANGKTQTTNLPVAQSEGFVLTLLPHLPVNVLLAIKVSPALVKNQKATILVQRQGKVIYAGQKVIGTPESLTKLPLDNFPSGIIQVTLFNENMQPLCERLFFNMNAHTALPLTANLDNQTYNTRQPVTVTLKAGAETDSMRNGTFSAAVVNLGSLPKLADNATGILSGLLLTPELKGYVERPDHYFETFDNDHMAELDNLILCQGWRRIVWDDVKAGKMPVVNYQPEKSFSISGTVTARNGTPAANTKVSLLSTKSYVGIDTVTDARGRYVFNNLLLNGMNRFSVHAGDDKHTVVLKVDDQPHLSEPSLFSGIQYTPDADYQNYLKAAYRQLPDSVRQRMDSYYMLKEVKVTTTLSKSKQVPAFSSNRNGAGNADEIFLADEMKYSMTLKQFLQGRAMGIKFVDDTPFTNRADNLLSGENAPKPMTIMMDGVELQMDGDAPLNWIPVEDVASIEILRTAATSALYGGNHGVIIITTKTGKGEIHYPSKPTPGSVPLSIAGYQPIREFYAPNYTVQNALPDHRTTIYWKPDIVADKAGNATFKFFTTDDKGTYQLTIEGITADGRPAHLVKNITVE